VIDRQEKIGRALDRSTCLSLAIARACSVASWHRDSGRASASAGRNSPDVHFGPIAARNQKTEVALTSDCRPIRIARVIWRNGKITVGFARGTIRLFRPDHGEAGIKAINGLSADHFRLADKTSTIIRIQPALTDPAHRCL